VTLVNEMGTPYILHTILSKTIQGLLVLHSKGQSVKEVSSLSLSLEAEREQRGCEESK